MTRDTENPYESPVVPMSRRRIGPIVFLLLAGAVVLLGALLWRATIAAEKAEMEAVRAREQARVQAEQARVQAEQAQRAAEDLMMKNDREKTQGEGTNE